MKAECIICFESTAQAIMAEKALLDAAFRVRVMPKPAVIQAGCGFCLRFLPDDIEKAVAFLAECGVAVSETYLMEEAGGTVSYTKSPLPASVRPIIASRQAKQSNGEGAAVKPSTAMPQELPFAMTRPARKRPSQHPS
jgi:hypothetical protein